MTLARELVQQLRGELHDTGDEPDRRYSDDRLLGYLNRAVKDILYRAPEANVVREMHTVAPSAPPLQTLASDQATKLIKVEANIDSRVDTLPDAGPYVTPAATYVEPEAHLGEPRWYQDYTIWSVDLPVEDLFRGLETQNGKTYPDVPVPSQIPVTVNGSGYFLVPQLTFYAECEARLANPVTTGKFVSIQMTIGFEPDFTYGTDPGYPESGVPDDPNIFWSHDDQHPMIPGSPGRHSSGPQSLLQANDASWDYLYGARLDNNWEYYGLGKFDSYGPGIQVNARAAVTGNPADFSNFRVRITAAVSEIGGFTEGPNYIELRNVRIRCPELERYGMYGAGLDLGYFPPHRRPTDGGPVVGYPFVVQPQGVLPNPAYAGTEFEEVFPLGWGGSSSYTGFGMGVVLGANSLYDNFPNTDGYTWPWNVSCSSLRPGGGVPPGEWEGNRVYFPSERGVPLREEYGFDGAIDELNISLEWMQASDQDTSTPLNMRLQATVQYSNDFGQTWLTLANYGSSGASYEDNPNFGWESDFTYVSPNTRPNLTNVRVKFDSWMGFPANSDQTPENDALVRAFRVGSTDYWNRWQPVTPLDPAKEDQTTPIRWVEKDVLDTYDFDWYYNGTPVNGTQDIALLSYYTHYSHDPRDPTRFYLYPAPPAYETYVYVHYSKVPDELIDIYDSFPLREHWEGAAVVYAKWLALSEQGRTSYAPEKSRNRLLNEYTTLVENARQALYSDSLRDDG